MINKIDKNLMLEVTTQSNKNIDCIVSATNFLRTKQELSNKHISFKEYPFTNSFLISCTHDKIVELSKLGSVEYLSKPTKVFTLIDKTKQFLNLEKLNQNKYFGKNITIAFIDTGIYPHIDFIYPYNRIINFKDLINNKVLPYDDNGHGTFVASVCTGSGKREKNRYSGVSPQANIVSIKALDKNGETNSNIILDAMQYVYDNAEKFNIKIVCMSFGADCIGANDPLQKGATALWNKGIVVVAAAGNSGPKDHTIKSPGTSKKIITVGGLSSLDNIPLEVASFSSRGPVFDRFKPDLIAPSVDITGCGINNKTPYIKMSGTSVATPIVAGISAIILEKNPNITPDRLKYLLVNNCNYLTHERNSEGFGYIKF